MPEALTVPGDDYDNFFSNSEKRVHFLFLPSYHLNSTRKVALVSRVSEHMLQINFVFT